MGANTKKSKQTIKKVLTLVGKIDKSFMPFLILNKMIAMSQPFITMVFGAMILDRVIEKCELDEIMKLVVIMALTNGITALIRWYLEKVIGVKTQVIRERTVQMVAEKSLNLDYEILEHKETLDKVFKAKEGMNSSGNIGSFCGQIGGLIDRLVAICYSLIIMLGACIPIKDASQVGFIGFMNSWMSTILLFAALIIGFIISSIIQKLSLKRRDHFFDISVEHNRRFQYFLNFMFRYKEGKDVRLYHMQDLILDELKACNAINEENVNDIQRDYRKLQLGGHILQLFLRIISYLFVGLKAILGLISVGNVMCFVGAFQLFCDGVGGLLEFYIQANAQSKYLALFTDFMELKNKKYEGTIPVEKRSDNKYEIEFRDVSFHYPNSEKDSLSHVNLKFKLGEKLAVVGPNGAGKTTFIKLLCRLYDPSEGEILLNGVNIVYYNYQEYMKLFSVVFQDFQLFAYSIAQNIASSDDYDEERIRETLEKAGLWDWIISLKDGIHTNLYQLQQNGMEISGGEAQKLAIARAVYKDAPYIIMDEPTSALDPAAEYDVYMRFDEMVKNKTAVYISHRMSSCKFCDSILVFDEGKIVQHGTHEELLKTGLYKELWYAQAKYYENEENRKEPVQA